MRSTWGWIALAALAALGAAHMYRYEPLPFDTRSGWTLVWDRWLQRMCVVGPVQTVGCTVEDLKKMSDSEGKPTITPRK